VILRDLFGFRRSSVLCSDGLIWVVRACAALGQGS